MGRHIGVTGPRKLTAAQEAWLRRHMERAMLHDWLHVGDAPGVDRLAKDLSPNANLVEYRVAGRQPWQYQARSKRMVEGLLAAGGTLYAYPNKPEPPGITRDCWQGSGTWGTIRYAQALGVPVVIVPLPGVEPVEPAGEQLALW